LVALCGELAQQAVERRLYVAAHGALH
jgi:hypothetical protein